MVTRTLASRGLLICSLLTRQWKNFTNVLQVSPARLTANPPRRLRQVWSRIFLTGYAPQPAYSQTRPTNEPLDPYGHPLIGRNDWVTQPGDRTNAGAAPPIRNNSRMNADMAQGPSDAMSMQDGPHQAAIRDEYGRRYDAQGNRLDARGNVIPAHAR